MITVSLFGVAFLIVAVMHLTLTALVGAGERDLFAAILRIMPASLIGALLILAAGFVDGRRGRRSGWRRSRRLRRAVVLADLRLAVAPAHFVERHGLIVIIAIGESLFAIGIGARGTDLARA